MGVVNIAVNARVHVYLEEWSRSIFNSTVSSRIQHSFCTRTRNYFCFWNYRDNNTGVFFSPDNLVLFSFSSHFIHSSLFLNFFKPIAATMIYRQWDHLCTPPLILVLPTHPPHCSCMNALRTTPLSHFLTFPGLRKCNEICFSFLV